MRLFVEIFSLVCVILGVLFHKIYAQGLDYFVTPQSTFSSTYPATEYKAGNAMNINQKYSQTNVDRHSMTNLHETETQQLVTEQPVKKEDVSQSQRENTSQPINTSTHRQKSVHTHSRDPSQTETFLGQVTLDSPADLPPEFSSREILNFEQPSSILFNINKQISKLKHLNKSEEIYFLGNNEKDDTSTSIEIGNKTNLTSDNNIDNNTKSRLEKKNSHSTLMSKISEFFFKSDKKSLITPMDLKFSKFASTSRIKSINLEELLEEPINNEEYEKHNNQDVEVIKSSAKGYSNDSVGGEPDKNIVNYTYTTNKDFDGRKNDYKTAPTVIVKYNTKNSYSPKENLKNTTQVLVLNKSRNSIRTTYWINSISTAETTKDPSTVNITTILGTTSYPTKRQTKTITRQPRTEEVRNKVTTLQPSTEEVRNKTTTLQPRTEKIINDSQRTRSQDNSSVPQYKEILLHRPETNNKNEKLSHQSDNLGYKSNRIDGNLSQSLNKSSFQNFNRSILMINTTKSPKKLWTTKTTKTMKIKTLFDKHLREDLSEKRTTVSTLIIFNATQGLKNNSKDILDTTGSTLSDKHTSFAFANSVPQQGLPIMPNGKRSMNNPPTLGNGLTSEINIFNRPLALVKLWTRANINFDEQPAHLIAQPTPADASTSTPFTVCKGDCELAGIIKLIDGVKWIPELLDKNTEEWHILAIEIQSELEKVYEKSELLKKWYKKIRVDGFSEGSVLVDYIVELNDIGKQINTLEIKKVFQESLDDVSSLDSSKVDMRKSNLGNFTIDPIYTDFIVLPHIEPTVGYAENIFLPQWAIAVIVIGLASFLFVIIFGITMLTSRRKTSKKKLTTTFSEDITEMSTKHMLEIEYYNKNLCNVD